MATQGTSISQAAHTTPTDSTKIPVSDGSGSPKHITLQDIKSFLSTEYEPQKEYAPKWTDATCSITCTKDGISTLMEIGSTKPTVSDFTSSGSTAIATSSGGTSMGGALSSSNIEITTSTSTSFVAKATRIYAAGTTKAKTSKGNPTNKTAYNSTTVLSSASVNSNIDSQTYTIKQITKTANYTITYVYAIYANITSIDSIAKLDLTNSTSVELDYPAETAANKHTFELPSMWQLSKVEVLNTLSGKYEIYDKTKFNTSGITHNDASGTMVTYNRYTRQDGTNGPTKFRITFTQ